MAKEQRKKVQARARLEAARKARRAEKRAAAEARRRAEAEEHARRKKTWAKARVPVEPPIYDAPPEDGAAPPFRAGFVALVGRPNVGKSTLLNALLGQKLAATTHKPQTTRKNLLGVLNPPGAQLLLLDTPGHHQAKGPLNRYMVEEAEDAVRQADVIAFLIEARADGRLTPGNERLLEVIGAADKPVVIALNKIDVLAEKAKLLHQIDLLKARIGERLVALVPISALRKDGLSALVQELGRALPEAEPLLSDDDVTSETERDIVREFIREKAMLELEEELPYSVAVTVERFEDLRPRLVRIFATLHVERPSQKGIVIGRQGSRLKAIGARARKDIEFLLGSKVFLDLSVRVTDGWSSDPRRLRELGYARHGPDRTSSAEAIAEAIASLPPETLAEIAEDEEALDGEDGFDDGEVTLDETADAFDDETLDEVGFDDEPDTLDDGEAQKPEDLGDAPRPKDEPSRGEEPGAKELPGDGRRPPPEREASGGGASPGSSGASPAEGASPGSSGDSPAEGGASPGEDGTSRGLGGDSPAEGGAPEGSP